MKIRIRLFAFMAQRAGVSELELVTPAITLLADVQSLVLQRFPDLAWPAGTLLAINQEYVADPAVTQVREGDEVAIIPPVSGG